MNAQNNAVSFVRAYLRPLLVSLCVGVLCTALLLLAAALLIHSVDIPRATVTPLAYAAAGVGAFAAGLTAALLAKRNGLMLGAVCGLALYLLILVAGCMSTESAVGTPAWIKPVLLTVAGAIGGVLGVNRKKR